MISIFLINMRLTNLRKKSEKNKYKNSLLLSTSMTEFYKEGDITSLLKNEGLTKGLNRI